MSERLQNDSLHHFSLVGACKRYGENVLFQNLELRLSPGRTVLIDGPNGSGKTQLLYALCGLKSLDLGRIMITGDDSISTLAGSAYRRDQTCRFIPAHPSELNYLSIEQFVHVVSRNLRPFHIALQSRSVKRSFVRLRGVLEEATGRPLNPSMPTSQLSIGQQKRLLLAATIFGDRSPMVLAVDEPLAALDAGGVETMLRLLRFARDRGIALAIAEHRVQINDVGIDERITMPFGTSTSAATREITDLQDGLKELRDQEACLSLRDAWAGYPGCQVYIEHFEVLRGGVAVLCGENGSGKTGFLKAMLGIPPAEFAGHIMLLGKTISGSPNGIVRPEIRYMSQNRESFSSLTVRDAMRAASPTDTVVDPVTEVALKSLDLRKRVKDLSSGNLALLSLAQTLAVHPKLALLDEPFANVDAANSVRMATMIANARREFGTAFLIVEHGPIDLSQIDRYTIKQDGTRSQLQPDD